MKQEHILMYVILSSFKSFLLKENLLNHYKLLGNLALIPVKTIHLLK